MIPSQRERSARADEAVSLLLVAGTTPHSGWQRLLPLFERAGCTLPESTLLEEWRASARGSAALGQSGVAMLHPGAHHQSLRSATATLLSACLSPALLAVDDMEVRAEFWLEELPGSRLLMLHCRPEAALVMAMNQERCLEEALAQWTSSAEAMVRLFRRHRARVTLIDVECALAAPIDFLRHCKTSFGFNPLPYSAIATACDRAGSDIQHLIAAQMVAQSRETQDLIAELEACSLPIGESATPPVIDCTALYAKHKEEWEQRKLTAEESDRYRLLAEEQSRRLTTTERSREEAVARLRESERSLVEEKAERELLAQHLHNARQALEVASLEQKSLSDSKEALLRLQNDLREMTAEKERQESRSEKLARAVTEQSTQMENFRDSLDSQERLNGELRKENELLTLQLHQIQAAIGAESQEHQRQLAANDELQRAQESLLADIRVMAADKEQLNGQIIDLGRAQNAQFNKISELEAGLRAKEQIAQELRNENKLLFLQLHQAQEELESCHVKLNMASAGLKVAEKDLGLGRQKLHSMRGKLGRLERKLQFRERRIRYMEESRSWRITAPLRNAAKFIFRKGKGEAHS